MRMQCKAVWAFGIALLLLLGGGGSEVIPGVFCKIDMVEILLLF